MFFNDRAGHGGLRESTPQTKDNNLRSRKVLNDRAGHGGPREIFYQQY